MRVMRPYATLLGVATMLGAGCGRVGFSSAPDAEIDAETDAPARTCSAWELPMLLPGLEAVDASGPTLTADLRTVYFDDDVRLYVADRASITAAFGAPTALALGNMTNLGGDADVTPDGRSLAFTDNEDLYLTTWLARGLFATPAKLASLGRTANPQISADASALRFDVRPGTTTVRATRLSQNAPFAVVGTLAELDPSGAVTLPADELEIIFERATGPADFRLFSARRAHVEDAFDPPTMIAEIPTFGEEAWISPDGQTLVYAVALPARRLWTTTRTCR